METKVKKAEDGLEALIGPFRLRNTVKRALKRGMLMPFPVSAQRGKANARLERGQKMREVSVPCSSCVKCGRGRGFLTLYCFSTAFTLSIWSKFLSTRWIQRSHDEEINSQGIHKQREQKRPPRKNISVKENPIVPRANQRHILEKGNSPFRGSREISSGFAYVIC